jgi:hypothetical protein
MTGGQEDGSSKTMNAARAAAAYVAAIDNVDIATADESKMRCRTQCRDKDKGRLPTGS